MDTRSSLQLKWEADAPLLVASDVSLLSTTGQPQLVEFFHRS